TLNGRTLKRVQIVNVSVSIRRDQQKQLQFRLKRARSRHANNMITTSAGDSKRRQYRSVALAGLRRRLRLAREILDIDLAECGEERALSLLQHGHHDVVEQRRSHGGLDLRVIGGAGRAQDFLGGDAASLAREFVAAARSAHTAEDALMDQGLQDRLEMTRRQAVARGERLGRNGL